MNKDRDRQERLSLPTNTTHPGEVTVATAFLRIPRQILRAFRKRLTANEGSAE